jgi:toluene monooxygenase system protein E
MLPRRRAASKLKTYSHLSRERRMPTDYELVTSELLYYPRGGFEVTTPMSGWYEEHQRQSALQATNWEAFVDPRETTYTKYVALARGRETYVDGILQSIEDSGYDASLGVEWRATLSRLLAALRFPFHGFQMISAYIGQMAPSGRITVAAAFQTGDELRRIQRIAYRMTQLGLLELVSSEDGREVWQRDPAWQPLREAVERCLTTYDWGESLVALNVCLKPIIDELFMVRLSRVAKGKGDYLLGQLFASLYEDCLWQREWTVALLEMAVRDRGENRRVIAGWAGKWRERALGAARALELELQSGGSHPAIDVTSGLLARIGAEVQP